MFNLDQIIAQPPLSVIISFFLVAGIDFIGLAILKKSGFVINKHNGWLRWQSPIVGAMFLAIILYPLALANLTSRIFMQIIASICFAVGIFHAITRIRLFCSQGRKLEEFWSLLCLQSHFRKILLFILFGMGLVAMSPSTNADSLDYHLGVAIAILNNGGMPHASEWFLGRLAGNGEVLNALGLAIGAEQFGSLLQYVSLLAIVSMILFTQNTNSKFNNHIERNISDLISLATFSAPVLLFLVGTAKPQMWAIAMTTLAFVLIIHPSRRKLSYSDALIGHTLISLLAMTAMQSKFNYLLGGGIVGLLSLIFMFKRGFFWASIAISLITAALVIFPSIFWKVTIYNVNWINALVHPLPGHLPGTDKMISYAQFNSDALSNFSFPLNILVPSRIGNFSITLGVGWLMLIGIKPGRDLWLWAGIFAAIVMIIVNIFFAPPSARMYLEPYFWLLFILSIQPNVSLLYSYTCTWLRWTIFVQAILAATATCFGALFLFPGALLPLWRTQVMEHYANGYEIMRWADSVLPKNAILLNMHRSMALSPRDAISSEWMQYINIKDPASRIYLDKLKSKKVSHILIVGPIHYADPISNCFGKVLAGPGIGHIATRNPFNQGINYEAWIVEFESARLPECVSSL